MMSPSPTRSGRAKPILGKVGIEDQQRLTRDTECKLHSREHDETFLPRYGIPDFISFLGGRLPHNSGECHIVVVGDRNTPCFVSRQA